MDQLPAIFEHFALPAMIFATPIIIVVFMVIYSICVLAPDNIEDEG